MKKETNNQGQNGSSSNMELVAVAVPAIIVPTQL